MLTDEHARTLSKHDLQASKLIPQIAGTDQHAVLRCEPQPNEVSKEARVPMQAGVNGADRTFV
jgi:hypothetical protein